MSDESPTPEGVELTRTGPALLAEPAIRQVNPDQLAMLRRTVAPDANDDQIQQFLEVCLSAGLNPWRGEAFCAVRDGRAFTLVGRDGLLKKANELDDYRGYTSHVVRDGDLLEVGQADGSADNIMARAGVTFVGNPMGKSPIVGAFAIAERAGMPPRFFYAPLDEYMPAGVPDDSSWKVHTSVMIDKVAISVVHRTLCGLSGIHVAEELDRLSRETTVDGGPAGPAPDPVAEDADIATLVQGLTAPQDFRDELLAAIREANRLSPRSWSIAGVQMRLTGQGRAALERELDNVRADVARFRAEQGEVDGSAVEDPPAPEVDPGTDGAE